jgi:hypothetical protein
VALSGPLILVSGLGSVIGPLVGTSLMAVSISMRILLYGSCHSPLDLRSRGPEHDQAAPLHLARPFEIPVPQATPLAHDPLAFSDELSSPDPVGITSDER